MPTANLEDEDDWTEVPVGPGNLDPIVSAVWRGYWDGVNNRARWLFNRLLVPLLGPFKTFLPGAIDTAADTISIPAHGLSTDDLVRFGNVGGAAFSVLGAPLSLLAGLSGLAWYVIKIDNDTIQFSLTPGGAAIDLTAAGTGTHYLFIVTSPLTAIVHPAFTPIGASTEDPAGSLYVTLAGYMLSVFGGRLQGPIRHYTAGAKIVDRTTSSNLPSVGDADATLTGFENYPCYRVPDQSANHVFTLPAPSEAGLRHRLMRVDASGGFGAAFKRAADASTVVALNAVGGADLHSYDSGDGKGLAWHAVGFGGASAVS